MIASKIKKRIIGLGPGAIFAPSDFLDIGSRASVDQALSRLANHGTIRRLTRGLYDYPKHDPLFGQLWPPLDDVARAMARKDNHVLQPSPLMAANQLGLSTQVPSTLTYMTDGPTRTVRICQQVIQFKHASTKTLVGAGQKTGIVLQALRHVGKNRVNDQVILKLARALDDKDRAELSEQSRYAPAWMYPIVQRIVAYA